MDISSSLNRAVNMYGTSTANNLNLPIENENKIHGSNIFSSEYAVKEAAKPQVPIQRKKKKNKRLNTIDTDFLPDEAVENPIEEAHVNFFIEKKTNPIVQKIKKSLDYFFTSTPLINYFYLKHKEQKIHNTIETLNDIMQNADELINTPVPFGENSNVYNKIAQNLTNAASVISKANKEL